jgi:hypothetical protein
MKIYIFLFGIFLMSNANSKKPPDNVLSQMEALSRIKAALIICFESQDYKKLSNKDALKMHDISINMDKSIEIIEKKYNSSDAHLAYMVVAKQYKSDPNFLLSFERTYSKKCAPQVFIDAEIASRKIHSTILSITK